MMNEIKKALDLAKKYRFKKTIILVPKDQEDIFKAHLRGSGFMADHTGQVSSIEDTIFGVPVIYPNNPLEYLLSYRDYDIAYVFNNGFMAVYTPDIIRRELDLHYRQAMTIDTLKNLTFDLKKPCEPLQETTEQK